MSSEGGEPLAFEEFIRLLSSEVAPSTYAWINLESLIPSGVAANNEREELAVTAEKFFYWHTFFATSNVSEPFIPIAGESSVQYRPEHLEYLSRRAKDLSPSFRAAIYSDFCWHFRSYASLTNAYEYAIKAIESYLHFVKTCCSTHNWLLVRNAFHRSLQLNRGINAKKESEIRTAFEIYYQWAQNDPVRVVRLKEILPEVCSNRYGVEDHVKEKIASTLLDAVGNPSYDSFLRLAALDGAFEIAEAIEGLFDQEQLKGLAVSYWQGISSVSLSGGQALSSVFWGRKAVEWLTAKRISIPDSIRKTSQQAVELAATDMRKVGTSFKIDQSEVDKILKCYSSNITEQDRLLFVSSIFRPVEIKAAEGSSSVLMNIISHCSILPEGGAAFGDGELSWGENNYVAMSLNFMTLNLSFLYYHSSLCTDFLQPEIVDEICGQPIFPGKLRWQFTEGFYAFLHGDFRKSILFLTPVFEASVRQLFILIGESTSSFRGDTQEIIPLNTLLTKPILKKIYGEELLVPWNYVFTSKRGLNIRNEFAHGLNSDNDSSFSRAALVWGYLLNLLLITKLEKQPGT